MRRSFKMYWYAILSNPVQMTMLLGFAICLALYIVTGLQLILLILLLYLLPFCFLELSLPHGRPRCLSRQLTTMFYALRGPQGRYTVVQKRVHIIDCRSMVRLLTAQQHLLPAALLAAPGKYRAITHETVLRRLKEFPGAIIESVRPVYMADMSATMDCLTKKKCKKCDRPCAAAIGRQAKRQFYDVRFTIREDSINGGLYS